MRAPMVIRWPGHIKPGTVKNDIFASLDWLPTLVDIAGGPKGDGLKKEIEEGAYPGHRQDHARWRRPARLSRRQVGQVGARHLLLLLRHGPVGGALQELEDVLRDGQRLRRPGFIAGVLPYHWTQVVNIKRDPFETSIGDQMKTLLGMGGALAAPVTAYIYDWNMLPIGQALWLKELETYIAYPPMQDPASYNLTQVMQQVKKMKTAGQSE